MDGGATENFEGGGWWTTTMVWTIVLFGSFVLNATLLFAFLKRPGLRTISNRFVMNLIASNLLTCLFLTSLLMLDAPPSRFGSSSCMISEGASAMVVASSILSVLLIAIDQYFAVVDPLRYRTRIDKLKCGVLIISVWLVAIVVALIAAFNPQPQSLWLSCRSDGSVENYTKQNLSFNINSTITFENGTEDYNVAAEVKVMESNGSSTIIEEDLEFVENSTTFFSGTILESSNGESEATSIQGSKLLDYITYGFAYAAFYTIFVYLVPFIAVCWIYVSIYLAAHKNSERARRTGSGPMLSSPSFCEEYGNVRRDFSTEDFRRIPKISSLSSIDESIETSPSQIPRRRSEMMLCSSPIEEEPSTGVVFTVGSQKVDVSPRKSSRIDRSAKENNSQKVPTSLLKAEFLGNRDSEISILDDNIRSKFRDRPDDRRKSSHDILCESIIRKDIEKFIIQDDSSDDSSADESEMFTFAKNRRLEDIEVAKCQNSIEDGSEYNNSIPLIEERRDLTTTPSANQPNNFTDLNNVEECNIEVKSSSHVQSLKRISNTVQTSNKPNGGGILSRAALENHNAKSRLQQNCRSVINGRFLNGYNRSDIPIDNPELDIFQKNTSGNNFLEAESSLLGTSAPVVTITPPNKIPLHRVSSIKSTSSYINSLKYRISNGSLFRYREETRAARISALVIVMGLICWTPYVVILTIRNLPRNYIQNEYDNRFSHSYDIMALSFLILAAYVTPLLFGYRSRRVKRELRKIFCFKKELSYKNNRSLMAKKVLKRKHSTNLSQLEMESKYNIFSCVYGRNRWPKEKVQFMQVPETALAVETCRSSFSSGASTQISTTSTEE